MIGGGDWTSFCPICGIHFYIDLYENIIEKSLNNSSKKSKNIEKIINNFNKNFNFLKKLKIIHLLNMTRLLFFYLIQ